MVYDSAQELPHSVLVAIDRNAFGRTSLRRMPRRPHCVSLSGNRALAVLAGGLEIDSICPTIGFSGRTFEAAWGKKYPRVSY